jgi:hypothetical protein
VTSAVVSRSASRIDAGEPSIERRRFRRSIPFAVSARV